MIDDVTESGKYRVTERSTYLATNENLEAMIAGLDVQPTDRVFAVAGSGDQVFALLEVASHVTAVDFNSEQVNLLAERIFNLGEGDEESFLNTSDTSYDNKRRVNYFKEGNRLSKIKAKLANIDVPEATDAIAFLKDAPDGSFDKVYLSNILGAFLYNSAEKIAEALNLVAGKLKDGALIYVLADIESEANFRNADSQLLPSVSLDTELSRKSQEFETESFWKPRVYRISGQ